jgi:hypothetical protein
MYFLNKESINKKRYIVDAPKNKMGILTPKSSMTPNKIPADGQMLRADLSRD